MKSKEEIELLAEKHYTQITLSERTAFKLGYSQCQEDMVDEIANLKKSVQKAVDIMCEADEEIILLKEQLNKQD
jgi:hypothetical protein